MVSDTSIAPVTREAMRPGLRYTSIGPKSNDESYEWGWRPDTPEFLDIVSTDVSSSSDSLFSQYIRSPSPSCSFTEMASDYSAETAVAREASEFSSTSQVKECSPQQELGRGVYNQAKKPQANSGGTPIRLRVNPPNSRIVLRLTRLKANTRARRGGKRG
jgi:hypothetical protein